MSELNAFDAAQIRRLRRLLDAFEAGRLDRAPAVLPQRLPGPKWTQLGKVTVEVTASDGVSNLGAGTVAVWRASDDGTHYEDTGDTQDVINPTTSAFAVDSWVELFRDPWTGQYWCQPWGGGSISGEVWLNSAFVSTADAAVSHLGVDTKHGLTSYHPGAGKFVVDAVFADTTAAGTLSLADQYIGAGTKLLLNSFVGNHSGTATVETVEVAACERTVVTGGGGGVGHLPAAWGPGSAYWTASGYRVSETNSLGSPAATSNLSAASLLFHTNVGLTNEALAGVAFDGSAFFLGVLDQFGVTGFGYAKMYTYTDAFGAVWTVFALAGANGQYAVIDNSTTYLGAAGTDPVGNQFVGGILTTLGTGGGTITVGTTVVSGGSTFGVLYNNGGVVGSVAPASPGQLFMSGSIAWVTMSGDATINSSGVLTLAASGVTAATYGDGTHVAQVTVDAKGRVTSASSVAITASSYTDAQAQAAVGGILADSATIDFTYNPFLPAISAAAIFQLSITSDASGLKLSGDSASPGNLSYYGTDASGTKGFFAVSAAARTEGTLAAAGTNQGTAAAITVDTVDVTGADGTKGVILPSRAGAIVVIRNGSGLNALKIYPPSGAQISSLGANVADGLTGGARTYVRANSTQWYTQSLL
jgi:hypothetical protein